MNGLAHLGVGEERLGSARGKVLADLEAHLVVRAQELVPSQKGRGAAVLVRHPEHQVHVKCVGGDNYEAQFQRESMFLSSYISIHLHIGSVTNAKSAKSNLV